MKYFRKLVISLTTMMLLCILLTGCEEPLFDTPWLYINEGDLETKTTTIKCTVSDLYAVDDTERVSSMEYSYGYGYNYSSGEYGYFYGLHPTSKDVVVTEYFVVLTDEDGTSMLFQVKNSDFVLLKPDSTISVQAVTQYTPEGKPYKDTKFYWGENEIQYCEDVTAKLPAETTTTKE